MGSESPTDPTIEKPNGRLVEVQDISTKYVLNTGFNLATKVSLRKIGMMAKKPRFKYKDIEKEDLFNHEYYGPTSPLEVYIP